MKSRRYEIVGGAHRKSIDRFFFFSYFSPLFLRRVPVCYVDSAAIGFRLRESFTHGFQTRDTRLSVIDALSNAKTYYGLRAALRKWIASLRARHVPEGERENTLIEICISYTWPELTSTRFRETPKTRFRRIYVVSFDSRERDACGPGCPWKPHRHTYVHFRRDISVSPSRCSVENIR